MNVKKTILIIIGVIVAINICFWSGWLINGKLTSDRLDQQWTGRFNELRKSDERSTKLNRQLNIKIAELAESNQRGQERLNNINREISGAAEDSRRLGEGTITALEYIQRLKGKLRQIKEIINNKN